MHYQYGADETQPAPAFVRVVAPTDIQTVSAAMARIIKDYYPGMDMLNPTLWHLLGAFTYEGPVIEFLQRVIALEREWKTSLNEGSSNRFKAELRSRHGYSVDDVVVYVRAYLQAIREGLVPDSIMMPWSYSPTSAAEDVGAAAAGVMKSVWPYALGALAVYALISAFAPNLIAGMLKPAR